MVYVCLVLSNKTSVKRRVMVMMTASITVVKQLKFMLSGRGFMLARVEGSILRLILRINGGGKAELGEHIVSSDREAGFAPKVPW